MGSSPGRAPVAAAVAISLAALGAAGWALREAREARRERSARAPGAEASADAAARLDAIEERLRRIEEPVAATPPAAGGASPAAASGSAADAVSDPAAREPLRALVKDVLREEREEALKNAPAQRPAPSGAERKPPLSQFAAELDLEPAQRESVRRTVHQGQEGMIALLRTPTASGRVPLDELLDTMLGKPEEARAKLVEIYGMLATERVPGSDRTYSERVEALKGEAVESFRREFTPEQFKEFEKTGQDPFEIQIPDSPWGPVLQDALRRRR
jgi:hypothetical protein